MKYEYKIALKHLTHRKGRGFVSLISFISVAGITLGVMALVVVLSVMSGFDRELKQKIVGANPHILVIKAGGIEDDKAVINKINALKLDGIESIDPFVEGQTLIRTDKNASGTFIKGIAAHDASLKSIASYLKAGSFNFLNNPNYADIYAADKDLDGGVALGSQLASLLGVTVGDKVSIISPVIEKKIFTKKVDSYLFKVEAIFELGMNTLDSTFALVNIEKGRQIFKLGNKSSAISIRLTDIFASEELKKIIRNELGYPYWVKSWIDMNRSFFSALKVEKNVMTVLLSLIILVAGFNIVSTLIMVVMEKTKDIGILKSLGATKRSIMDIFILQGFAVGFVGTALGATLGLALTFNLNQIAGFLKNKFGFEVFPSDIYYFNEIPTQVNTTDIVIIVTSALFISVIASFYPAKRAASLNPVEALRYE